MSVANEAQAAYWNDTAGAAWAALQEQLDAQIEPLGNAAIDALAPATGERVVDVGCGCGQTSLALARRVGPSGAVLGLDLSRPMLAVARRRAAAAGLGQVAFAEGDAQVHPFEPGGLDGAYSRFGVMFFADPPAAFGNIRAGLKRGGRLAFVCWRAAGENPWMTIPLLAALTHLPAPPPPDPLAPGPFAFADAGRVRTILTEAGFADVDIRPHDQKIGAGDLDQAVAVALRVGPLGALLRAHPDAADTVVDAIREALAQHDTGEGPRLPSASWIVTAKNP